MIHLEHLQEKKLAKCTIAEVYVLIFRIGLTSLTEGLELHRSSK